MITVNPTEIEELAETRGWLNPEDPDGWFKPEDRAAALADILWAAENLFPADCGICDATVATIAGAFDWDMGEGWVSCRSCGEGA